MTSKEKLNMKSIYERLIKFAARGNINPLREIGPTVYFKIYSAPSED